MEKSNIFILSGPSGAGEDSIIAGLKAIMPIEKIITTTTRTKRPGEVDGVEYYFVSKEDFLNRIEKNEFFEYAQADGGNYYGVTKDEIERAKKTETAVVWKIDYKGVINAKKLMPEARSIFLDVPLAVIEKRIRKRDHANEEYIQERLKYAMGWYENRDKFDFCVKNEDGKLNEAIEAVAEIIRKNQD